MKRLGVVGTLVWDRIWSREALEAGAPPVEDWGGIAYSLGAAAAACPRGWEVVPIVKLGHDLEAEARRFFDGIEGLHPDGGLLAVAEPMNRVELRYHDAARRCERLSGGVGPWRWEELAPRIGGLDALFINFISGFEMELEVLERLRAAFAGPIYVDIHSLMLGRDGEGRRSLRPLPEWERWLRCADVAQLNEDELRTAAGARDPWELACSAAASGPQALLVTLGAEGAAVAGRTGPIDLGPRDEREEGAGALPRTAPEVTRIPLPGPPVDGDPTGCGDVWGATVFCGLLAGSPLREAVLAGHRAAAAKVARPGASGLQLRLRRAALSR